MNSISHLYIITGTLIAIEGHVRVEIEIFDSHRVADMFGRRNLTLISKYYHIIIIAVAMAASLLVSQVGHSQDTDEFPNVVFIEGGERSRPYTWHEGMSQIYDFEKRFSHIKFLDPHTGEQITDLRILRDDEGVPIRASVGDFSLKFDLEPYSRRVSNLIDELLDEIQMITYSYGDREGALEILETTSMYQEQVAAETELAMNEFLKFLIKKERYFGALVRFRQGIDISEMTPEDLKVEADVASIKARSATFASYAMMLAAFPLTFLQPIPGPGIATFAKALSAARLSTTYHELSRQLNIRAGVENVRINRSSAEYVYLALFKVSDFFKYVFNHLNRVEALNRTNQRISRRASLIKNKTLEGARASAVWASNFVHHLGWDHLKKTAWLNSVLAFGRSQAEEVMWHTRLTWMSTSSVCGAALRSTIRGTRRLFRGSQSVEMPRNPVPNEAISRFQIWEFRI